MESISKVRHFDVIVVGAGFAGMYAVHKIRSSGLSVLAFDEAGDVGGVWYWNRYPGAVCDIDSRDYSYAFSEELQKEWVWTTRNATQTEILAYAKFVADKFDLRRSIKFNTRIESTSFDEAAKNWIVKTNDGETLRARFVIMATGPLSVPHLPDIAGLKNFSGRILHTGKWPHEDIDFKGRSVGLIGTGSSGIQLMPHIAHSAKRLYVFQRTPQYALPIQNFRRSQKAEEVFKQSYPQYRKHLNTTAACYHVDIEPQPSAKAADPEEREFLFEVSWGRGLNALMRCYSDLLTDMESNELAADFVRRKIRSIVKDPEVARKLTPTDYPIGSKRLPLESGYWQTFNRSNVTLVDLRESAIKQITASEVETTSAHYRIDDLVFATGFDALTGALVKIDIRGRDGCSLKDKWTSKVPCYLGLTLAGFPNLFVISGPGSPSALANLITSSEFHVDWIVDCIKHLDQNGKVTIEADANEEDNWYAEVSRQADSTILSKANSWWVGANIPGKPRGFLPYSAGYPSYVQRCREIAAGGYRTFRIS